MNKWKLQAKIADTEIQRLRIRIAELEEDNEQLRSAILASWSMGLVPEQAPGSANPERVNNGCSIYRSPDESAS